MANYIRYINQRVNDAKAVRNALESCGINTTGFDKHKPFILVNIDTRTITQMEITQYELYSKFAGNPECTNIRTLIEVLQQEFNLTPLSDGLYYAPHEDDNKDTIHHLSTAGGGQFHITNTTKRKHNIPFGRVVQVRDKQMIITPYGLVFAGCRGMLIKTDSVGNYHILNSYPKDLIKQQDQDESVCIAPHPSDIPQT